MRRPHAFSLVELSIVLVILGLLTGGILAGRSLIRASELRSVGTQADQYRTAIFAFRDKYFYLPGDLNNAQSFWGTVTSNGNGDGTVVWSSEGLRAWQQLALAGLVEGSYSGSTGSTSTHIGGSVPAGKVTGSGYQFWNEAKSAETWTGGDSANAIPFLRFAGLYQGADPPVRVGQSNLRGEEAWNIDSKMDDGRPGSGRVFVYNADGGCNSGGDVTTSTYLLSGTNLACMIQFVY